jgi:hypothetical protein
MESIEEKKVNNPLKEYLENETEEQKLARNEKRKETCKQKRIIEVATRKAMKQTWVIPIFEDKLDEEGKPVLDKEGKPIRVRVKTEYKKTPEMIAARLIQEAVSPFSKNVVGAVREIRDILGEKDPEKLDVELGGVQVVFASEVSKYAK